MGSETQYNLPVIDFSEENLKEGTSSWFLTCKKVRDALEENSCFFIHYPTIKTEVRDAVFLASQEFFELPIQTKVKNNNPEPDQLRGGYIGQLPQNPTYEGMVIDATNQEAIANFTSLMWPSGNDRFCEIVEAYKKQVLELEKMVMRIVFECFGVGNFYGDFYESHTAFLAFNKHRPPLLNEKLGGAEEHTDPTFITVVDQVNNGFSSLEVKTSKEEGSSSWIAVDLPPSSFLVMAGDALLGWSNGRVQSTIHRVRMSARETRFSILSGSFHNGTIQVPEEVVDEEHPLQYKPFNHFGLYHFALMNPSQLGATKMRNYCGI